MNSRLQVVRREKQMDISIIIPSYHRVDLLEACLRSVTRHAPAHTQIIVVDDASPHGVVSRTAESFQGVEVVRQKKRSGFCTAINAGLTRAQRPIVNILNDDTEVQPGWTVAPCLRIQTDKKVAAVAPLVLQWRRSEIIDSAGDEYDPGGFAFSRGKGQPLAAYYLQAHEVFSASGCGAFYRKDALLEVGGFPEHFRAYFEDVDVGFRLRRAGYRCWYEPSSRILHHGSATHGRRPGRRLAEQLARNEERVFCQYFPSSKQNRTLVRHAGVLLAKACRRWGDGTLVPFFMGRLRAWGERCGMMRVQTA